MDELKAGFQKMKKALDKKKENYKILIFELEEEDDTDRVINKNEEDKDADDIRFEASEETLRAIPMMKEEFIDKLVSSVFDDQEHELANKIALGCQQVARSVCFVHFWAFNSLWLTFNQNPSSLKKEPNQATQLKQLLEQAEQEK